MLVSTAVKDPLLALLHVRCLTCRAAVTLHVARWPEHTEDSVQEWACPHCKATNLGSFLGRFVRAMPWYEPEPNA